MKLKFIKTGDSSLVYRLDHISRAKVIQAVENSILYSDMDRIHPALAERLREIAKTTDKVAVRTWEAKLIEEQINCGCPLTQAGVVSFHESVGKFRKDWEGNLTKTQCANKFFRKFDGHFPGNRPQAFIITD
jgi:hypothetical protein